MKRPACRIDYASETEDHLALLTARQSATVLDVVLRQLSYEPTLGTRNRGPLRPNPVARFRLRVGDLQVDYDVEEVPERAVIVRAVGIKVRNRVFIGGKEIEL